MPQVDDECRRCQRGRSNGVLIINPLCMAWNPTGSQPPIRSKVNRRASAQTREPGDYEEVPAADDNPTGSKPGARRAAADHNSMNENQTPRATGIGVTPFVAMSC